MNSIVVFILVIINDVVLAVLERSRHILEVIKVEWVSQDIV